MNPQDREEYGMDLAIKKREEMSEEYIKIEPSEAKVGDYTRYLNGVYDEIVDPELLNLLTNLKAPLYRKKAEPIGDFEEYWENKTTYFKKIIDRYFVAEEAWQASRESLFAEITEEEWEFLKCIYNHPYNRDISNKLIRLALATRKD